MNRDQDKVDKLQKEMDIMKQRYEQLLGPFNPNFDPSEFRKAILFYFMSIFIPLFVLTELSLMNSAWLDEVVQNTAISGVPLFSLPGDQGIALGIFAIGGLSIGIFALGGFSIGLIACGGGAIGLIAAGGGAAGMIAIGGGAIGYIAIGGGAIGRYTLAGGGKGISVLSYRRQDREAAEFFCWFLRKLRKAFPNGIEGLKS